MDENSQELLFEVFLGIVACLSIFVIHLPIFQPSKVPNYYWEIQADSVIKCILPVKNLYIQVNLDIFSVYGTFQCSNQLLILVGDVNLIIGNPFVQKAFFGYPK